MRGNNNDEARRRRWLPKALPAGEGLDRLAAWQRHSYKIVKIHFAFIEGVNDDVADVHAICDAIESRGLYVHVNVVRYNPPSPRHGREPSEAVLQRNLEVLRQRLPAARVRIVIHGRPVHFTVEWIVVSQILFHETCGHELDFIIVLHGACIAQAIEVGDIGIELDDEPVA